MPLRFRMWMLLLIVATLSLGAVVFTHIVWQSSQRQSAETQAAAHFQHQATQLNDQLFHQRRLLLALAQSPEWQSQDPEAIRQLLRRLSSLDAGFERLYRYSQDGRLISGDDTSFLLREHAYRVPLDWGQPLQAISLQDPQTQSPVLLLATPLRDASGRSLGALTGTLPLRTLLDPLATTRLTPSSQTILFDHRGRVLATHGVEGLTPLQPAGDASPQARAAWEVAATMRAQSLADFLQRRIEVDETASLVQVLRLANELDGYLVAIHPMDTLLPAGQTPHVLTALLLGIFIAAIAAALLVDRQVFRRISHLLKAEQTLTSGHSKTPLPEHGKDEISQMTKAFNRMASRWLQSQESMRQSENNLIEIFRRAPVPMSYSPLQRHGLKSYWNQSWYQAFGYPEGSKEGLAGHTFDFWEEPVQREVFAQKLMKNRHVVDFEAWLLRMDGSRRLCLVSGTLAGTGEQPLTIVTYLDITDQRATALQMKTYQSIVESANDGIIFLENGLISSVNLAACRMYRGQPSDLLGRRSMALSPAVQPDGRDSATALDAYIRERKEKGSVRFLWQSRRVDGSFFLAQIALSTVAGNPERAVALLRDVSEEHAAARALEQSEARLRTVMAVSNTGLWEFHRQSGHFWCSPEYFSMLGHEPDGFKVDGQISRQAAWLDLIHPEDRATADERFQSYLAGQSNDLYESTFRMRHADGSWVWILSRGQTLRQGDQALADITVGTHINVTDIRKAQEDLRDSRDQFQSLINHLSGTVYRCRFDADWTMLYLSSNIDSITGYSAEELIHSAVTSYGSLNHPDDNARVANEVAAAIEARQSWEVEYRVRHRDGEYRWVSETGRAVRDSDDQVLFLDGFIIDITAKKQTEIQLLESQALMRITFDMSPEPQAQVDMATGRFIDVNRMWVECHGIAREQAIGRTGLELGLWYNPDDRLAIFQLLMEKGRIDSAPVTYRHSSGYPIHCEVSATLFDVGDRRVTLWAARDITRRKLAEEDLRASQLQLESISNNLPNSMVYQVDCGPDGQSRHFTYLSAGVEHLHGLSREAVMTQPSLLYEQIDPEDAIMLSERETESVRSWSDLHCEYRGKGPRGEPRWFALSSTPSRTVNGHIVFDGIETDITTRKEVESKLEQLNQSLEARVTQRTWELTKALDDLNRTQHELIQSEKLAALGSLVAGVAHELNTPIGNAITVASTVQHAHVSIQKSLASGLTRQGLQTFVDTVGEASDMLDRNLRRAADLVNNFKQLAVDQASHQRRSFGLLEAVEEVCTVMTPSLRKAGIQIRTDIDPDLTLDSYPGALSQTLMILISNATTHAFTGRESGSICITGQGTANGGTQIEVIDDGVGIPPEHIGRIFEPFFTTRLGQGGSGLGLHILYNMVKGVLSGRVSVHSAQGQGTTFTLNLPKTPGAIPPEA